MKRQKRKKGLVAKHAVRKPKKGHSRDDLSHKMRAEQRMLGLLGIVLLVLFLNVYFYEGQPLTGYATAIDSIEPANETPSEEGKNLGIFILIGLFTMIALFVFVKKRHP